MQQKSGGKSAPRPTNWSYSGGQSDPPPEKKPWQKKQNPETNWSYSGGGNKYNKYDKYKREYPYKKEEKSYVNTGMTAEARMLVSSAAPAKNPYDSIISGMTGGTVGGKSREINGSIPMHMDSDSEGEDGPKPYVGED